MRCWKREAGNFHHGGSEVDSDIPGITDIPAGK